MHLHMCSRVHLGKEFSICIYEMLASEILIATRGRVLVPDTIP